MTKSEALAEIFLFKGMDFNALNEKYVLSDSCIESEYTNNQLIAPTDNTIGLPIMISGHARIVSSAGTVLRCMSEGDCFGAASIFDRESVSSTEVYSVGDCKLITLPLLKLEELLSNEGDCAINYIEFLSSKVSFLNRKIAAFTAGSAEAKLALYLSGLCLTFDGSVMLSQSHLQLSKMLDIGRASLYRAFDSLQEAGIIKKEGHKITILDNNALKALIK